MSNITRIDYAAARVRLEAVTSNRAVLEGFDRMIKSDAAGEAEAFNDQARLTRWNDAMGAFLAAVCKRRISLDYLFFGKGKPIMSGVAS